MSRLPLHDLPGDALHLDVLGRGLHEDEGAACAFEVGEALLDDLGRAYKAGLQASVGDGVVAQVEMAVRRLWFVSVRVASWAVGDEAERTQLGTQTG